MANSNFLFILYLTLVLLSMMIKTVKTAVADPTLVSTKSSLLLPATTTTTTTTTTAAGVGSIGFGEFTMTFSTWGPAAPTNSTDTTVTTMPIGTTTSPMTLEESKEILFQSIPKEEQDKIIKKFAYDPSLVKDYIPFLVGGYSDAVRKNLSYTVNETFLGAAFEGKELNLYRDFTEIYDKSLGTCYTFNHANSTTRYKLRSPGIQGGLSVALRVYPQEYLSWTVTSGFLVFVHNGDEAIVSDSPRTNSRSGAASNLVVQMTRYERLGGKYGKCITDTAEVKSFYYPGSYTTDGCLRSCYQDAAYDECGCMDPRFPSDPEKKSCNLAQRECLNDMLNTRGDPSEWSDCSCPMPCTNTDYTVTWSETILNKVPIECSYPDATTPPPATVTIPIEEIIQGSGNNNHGPDTGGSSSGGGSDSGLLGTGLGGGDDGLLDTLLPGGESTTTQPAYSTYSTQTSTSTTPVTLPAAIQASDCSQGDVYYYDPVDYLKITVSVRIDTFVVYSEKPAMTFSNMLSFLGGISGVIMGLSVISFIEFAALIYELIIDAYTYR